MGNKHSSSRQGSEGSPAASGSGAARPPAARQTQPQQRQGGRTTVNNGGTSGAPPSNMPPHLANQYQNHNENRQQPAAQQQQRAAPQPAAPPPQAPASSDRGVQEGQMVKMLATIEASTVSFNPETRILTFFITSICPSLTYEIHTGVKEFVEDGGVFYMPNRPKMEPTWTAIEGPQENKKISVRMDLSRLEDKELVFNKHYPKQMPCVIIIRYRTTELRRKDGSPATTAAGTNNDDGEEVVVEHTEHTAVDLSEKPRRRVISQIVTAGGSAYVVENLYGADNDGGGGGGGDGVMVGSTIAPHEGEEDEDGLCIICLTNQKDTAVMPCRHMCMCKECGEQLLKHKPVCPVCRAPISTLLHMPRK